jgi:putative ABC transport system permease protein
VRFDYRASTFSSNGVPYPMARFVEAHSALLSAVLLRHRIEVVLSDQSAERVTAAFVTTNWFDELGGGPAMGRLFGRIDDAPGAAPAVVVSYRFWQRRLAGRPDVAGSTIRLNDQPAVVIGVAREDFPDVGLALPSVWMPVSQVAYFVPGSRVGKGWDSAAEMFARVKAGVSADALRANTRSLLAGLHAQDSAHVKEGEWLEPAPGTARFLSTREAQQTWVVVAAVAVLGALVLMIACLNLGNLALARAISRVREMSIRVALGAGRGRVVRHMLTESAVVAALGSTGGLMCGVAAARMLAQLAGSAVHLDVTPDWRLGLVILGVALFAVCVVGLIPAWKIGRSDLAQATQDGGERVAQGLHAAKLRYVLLTAQMAASCVLMVFTAQLARSLQRALEPDPGFDYANVAVLDPSLNAHGVEPAAAHAYWETVRQSVEAQPEAMDVAIASYAPLNGDGASNTRYRSTPGLRIANVAVEPAFFSVMRIPIVAGRVFGSDDDPLKTTIVSRRVAIEMYGTLDVVGRLFPKDEPRLAIVGVAGDAHFVNLRAPDAAERYVPLGRDRARASLLVRARTDPARLLAPLRQASRSADARVLPDVRLMRDDYVDLVRLPRLLSSMAGGISAIALGLVCLGIFGVVSHGARLRTKEVGIRLALGAPRGAVVGTLLRRTAWSAAAGLAGGLGIAGALAMTGTLGGAPFYLETRDPMTYVAAAAIVLLAGGAAAILPALKMLRADPLRALRES